jgi:hypothetical protein
MDLRYWGKTRVATRRKQNKAQGILFWLTDTNVSEERAASIFAVKLMIHGSSTTCSLSPGYKHKDSSRLPHPATLQRQAARSSHMRVLIYQTTWRHISELSTLQASNFVSNSFGNLIRITCYT